MQPRSHVISGVLLLLLLLKKKPFITNYFANLVAQFKINVVQLISFISLYTFQGVELIFARVSSVMTAVNLDFLLVFGNTSRQDNILSAARQVFILACQYLLRIG